MTHIIPDFITHLPLREITHKPLCFKVYHALGRRREVAARAPIQYHRAMALGQQIQAWRISRGHSVDDLAAESHLSPHVLEEIEAGAVDPSASLLEALAAALKIPPCLAL